MSSLIDPPYFGKFSQILGKPFVTVTPNGPNDGGDYGPNTPGTSTAGIQEALNDLNPATGGIVFLKEGTYNVTSNITLPNPSSKLGQTFGIVGSSLLGTIINLNGNQITNTLSGWSGDNSLRFRLDNLWIQQAVINCPFMLVDWGIVRIDSSASSTQIAITLGGGGGPSTGSTIVALELYDYNTSRSMTHIWFENLWIGRLFMGYFGATSKTVNFSIWFGVSVTINSCDCFVQGQSGIGFTGTSAFIWNEQASAGEGMVISHMTLASTGTMGKATVFLVAGTSPSPIRVHHLSYISTGLPPWIIGSSGFGITGGDSTTLSAVWITDYPSGWQIPTPSLPAGTGSTNAVQNTNRFPVRIYQPVSTALGTHIVDPFGTDKALPSDPAEIVLAPFAKIYYATAVPASWLWSGGL